MSALPTAIHDAVVRLVGTDVSHAGFVAGGDINRACVVTLTSGRKLFVKFNPDAPRDLFEAEARGLSWLKEANAVTTPEVVAYSTAPPLLILEYVAQGRPGKHYADVLGRSLAALHSTPANVFGGLANNYIGTLHQDNTSESTFAEFWWRRRLEPQLRLARNSGAIPPDWVQRFDVLATTLPRVLLEPKQPERLHGDLWSGNVMCNTLGDPVLVDPAAYAGHGEIDLAMMRLFGGFDPRVESAYLEVRPAEPGRAERLRLLQLYPLLVHTNLFGGVYVRQVSELLKEFV